MLIYLIRKSAWVMEQYLIQRKLRRLKRVWDSEAERHAKTIEKLVKARDAAVVAKGESNVRWRDTSGKYAAYAALVGRYERNL